MTRRPLARARARARPGGMAAAALALALGLAPGFAGTAVAAPAPAPAAATAAVAPQPIPPASALPPDIGATAALSVPPTARTEPATATASAAPAGHPPSFEAFRARWQPSDAVLLDRHGRPLASRRIDPQGRRLGWVALADTSPALPQALIAAEDRRFHDHAGVDWAAVATALWQQWRPAALGARPAATRGASTISMQVAALLDPALARPGGPRSVAQKWSQIEAALALERHWTKAQILEAYLNTVHFRGELQGLGAASQGLFGKAPSGLDAAESALLAALVRAPNAASALVARRACGILAVTRGTGEPCDAAGLALTVAQARLAPPPVATLAPHTARRLLPAPAAPGASPAAADGQPLAVRSSLDADIQRLARDALAAQLALLRGRGVEDGAVVVLHNRTGEVLAHVGSGGPFSAAAQVDAADAPRQAGSTLKPLLYALAFAQQRLQPATLLDDSPLALATDAGLYTPQNYDQRFTGPVPVREALAGSLNIPAVRALGLVGVPAFHGLLGRLGLDTLDRDPAVYGPSLALGSADVTLLALTNAYRSLANGGVHGPLRWTPGDSPAASPAGERLLPAPAAWLVGHILADNAARAATFGPDSVLATRFWTAVKTGTSKDLRDNWCIGWSADYTVGVWVGNASGAPMRDVSGVSGAAPAWAQVMRGLHRDRPSPPPAPPPGLVQRVVQFEAGLAPTRSDWFLAALAPPGAGPVTVRLAEGSGRPRILAPADGTLVAWDPDIPPALQALVIRHSAPPGHDGLRWWLDGSELPAADARLALPLVAGRHLLALRDAGGTLLDQVRFEVRGGPARTAAGGAAVATDPASPARPGAPAPPLADQAAASSPENSGSALVRGR